MRIVKPYGRSSSERDEQGYLRRVLHTTADRETPREPTEFAESHPELVIAQWASVIDKIARKPRGSQKPTREQRKLREELGQVAFRILDGRGVFAERRDELKRLWWRKIHPYGGGEGEGEQDGHYWFEVFAGRVKPTQVDADAVARKIERHLYVQEFRHRGARLSEKRVGLIAARAESIARNAPRPPSEAGPSVRSDDPLWSAAALERYESAGDVAARIVQVARDLTSKAGRGHPRMSMRDAAPVLHEQFGRLFRGADGAEPTIQGAREAEPVLYALHMAIKDAYTGILKGRRTKDVFRVLPRTMDQLMCLVKARRGNRELANLIRLGKVIHYAAAPAGHGDQPANVVNNWPDGIESSHYWTSKGQSEIKRNEALVRVWRGVVALAARTVKDWADPQGGIDRDILSADARQKALNENFDAAACRRKIGLLFGERSDILASGSLGSLLELALLGLGQLRNSSFHFKGRQGFANALVDVGKCGSAEARNAAHELWRADEGGRATRLGDTMRGAHFDFFLCRDRCQAVFDAVSDPLVAHPPLPRFRRILRRAENAWPEELRLPPPGNRTALEDRGRLCQYTALRLVYERAFPEWLAGCSARDLNNWINRAAMRAIKDAQRINDDPHAVARIDRLARLHDRETVDDFFDRLAAATATEFRVQRGYDPDPDKAREQSRYLENARLDVVAQAFKAYLEDAGFAWLLEEFSGPSEKPLFDIGSLSGPTAPRVAPEDWMAVLYFLVHLVPVADIAALRHQLRKWTVLEPSPSAQVEAMGRVFDLYIDMHDAKFKGGWRVYYEHALRELFENDAIPVWMYSWQPASGVEEDAGHVPWRGLREILRFGVHGPLMPIFAAHPITLAMAEELEKAETKDEGGTSAIAAGQKRRKELHAKWVKKKDEFSHSDRKAYRDTLAEITHYRHCADHVRLDNYARLHRLSIRVLGRLVDYAGLWERDLYFATLALFSHRGKQPRDVPDNKWQKLLGEGRIVDALRRLEKQSPSSDGGAVFNCLKERFGACFLRRGPQGVVRVRNDLAHFNMLKKDRVLNLTEAVNNTRRLMTYDRKLKNAVSKSVIEMLRREGLDLSWQMEESQLRDAKIAPWQIKHLGDEEDIRENLCGDAFVAMVAEVFDGQPLKKANNS